MATGTPGTDHPDIKDAVDVRVAGRDDTLVSFVEDSGGDTITVTVGVDRSGRRVRLDAGTDLELVWRSPEGPRALPAELVELVHGDEPRWVLRPVGPATVAQRRDAVRAPVLLPVELRAEEVRLVGETLDISEGGLRCLVQPADRADGAASYRPEVGAVLEATVTLEAGQVPLMTRASVRRVSVRADRHVELSVAFVDLPERVADRVRARVFTELRLLRARGVL